MEHKSQLKRKVNCSSTTFGSEPAAAMLSQILNQIDNPHVTAKVSKLFRETCKLYKSLYKLERKEYLFNLVISDLISTINGKPWPDDLKSFLKNCLITKSKQYLKTF